jgi:signal transduction histidine kinase
MQQNFEEHRQQWACRLHDHVTMSLAQLKLRFNLLCRDLITEDSPKMKALKDINQNLDGILVESRHIMGEIRPPALDDLGLGDALAWQARLHSQKTNVDIHLTHNLDEHILQEPVKTAVFRLFQDLIQGLSCLTEASAIRVKLDLQEERLQIHYLDNGIRLSEGGGEPARHREIITVRGRILGLGGKITFNRAAPEGNDLMIDLSIKPMIDGKGSEGGP